MTKANQFRLTLTKHKKRHWHSTCPILPLDINIISFSKTKQKNTQVATSSRTLKTDTSNKKWPNINPTKQRLRHAICTKDLPDRSNRGWKHVGSEGSVCSIDSNGKVEEFRNTQEFLWHLGEINLPIATYSLPGTSWPSIHAEKSAL